MLRQILKFYPRRNFSNSAVWKDSKKEVASTPKQEAQTTTTTTTNTPPDERVVQIDFIPNELDKFILVYSGKYKSKDEIPPRVGYSTINTAKSKVRIKLANYLILGTILMFGYSIWKGKQNAKAGDTIVAREIALRDKLVEEARIKKDY